MQFLIASRWYLLVAALFCGAILLLPIIYPASQYWNVRPDALLMLTPILQGAGTRGMSDQFKARGVSAKRSVLAGYVSAVAWLIAVVGGLLAQASGAGGLVFGFFLVLPGIAIGLVTQIIAFVSFVRAEPRSPAA
jgi:hypothetical protein